MKKRIILYSLLLMVFFAACTEKEKITIGETTTPVLSNGLSSTDAIIEEATLEDVFCTFSWNKADFGFKAPNSEYTLWINQAGADFADAKILATTTDTELSFTNAEMNQRVLSLGATPSVSFAVEFILKSTLEGQLDTESNTIAMNITPLEVVIEYPKLYVTGDHNSWGFDEDNLIYSVNDDGIYEGYVNFDNPALLFKLSHQPNWDNADAIIGDPDGSGTTGTLQVGNWGGNNVFVPDGVGYYRLKANLNSATYSIAKTEWGMSGDFNGWGNTVMIYDADADTWTYTGDMTTGGIKFIANGAWNIYYGGSTTEGVLENPGENIAIAEDGNYTVTLDLSKAIYKYTIVKN